MSEIISRTAGQSLDEDQREMVRTIILREIHSQKSRRELVSLIESETQLRVSIATVQRMWREVLSDLQKEYRHRAILELPEIANRYKWAMEEAADAWERSKQPYEKVVTREKADGESQITTTRIEAPSGQPMHLEMYMRALEGLRALLGVDAPERIEYNNVNDDDEMQIDPANAEVMAGRLRALLLAAQERKGDIQ